MGIVKYLQAKRKNSWGKIHFCTWMKEFVALSRKLTIFKISRVVKQSGKYESESGKKKFTLAKAISVVIFY